MRPCPACAKPIRYFDMDMSRGDGGPWGFNCPHCDAHLRAPLLQLGSIVSVALVIGAMALGAYLELIDVLPPGGMYWFWGACAVGILVLWVCLWTATDFVPYT